ncbi:MAG: hypothetical protein HC815_41190 [Richelia sp. RM1_1_1]|nr:hypothetical protein [Richelia sp. RM1_1_1]
MTTKGKKQPSHLDKLLNDKPAEFQAKVLRFALDSGMQPEDPAFRLVQYIGYLAQLTETAPQDWKDFIWRTSRRARRLDGTNSRAAENSSRPERDNQQFSSLLQQAWDSIERARFNITAAVGAIEELNRNLTDFEKRRARNTDAEKTVGELEPSIDEPSNLDCRTIEQPNPGVEKGNDDLPQHGIDFDKEGDGGVSKASEKDNALKGTAPRIQDKRNLGTVNKRGFDLDL